MLPNEPDEVRFSALLWLLAVAAGLFETGLVVLHAFTSRSGVDTGIITGALFRLVIFAGVGVLIANLRRGRNWARLSLAVLLGGFGLLSLAIGPAEWLADGNSLTAAIDRATPETWLFAGSRVVHVAAVLGALVLMFRPRANQYFRRVHSGTASAAAVPGSRPGPAVFVSRRTVPTRRAGVPTSHG